MPNQTISDAVFRFEGKSILADLYGSRSEERSRSKYLDETEEDKFVRKQKVNETEIDEIEKNEDGPGIDWFNFIVPISDYSFSEKHIRNKKRKKTVNS